MARPPLAAWSEDLDAGFSSGHLRVPAHPAVDGIEFGDDTMGLVLALQEVLVAVNGDFGGDPVDVEVVFKKADGFTSTHELTIAVPSEGGALDLHFPDGTRSHFDLDISPAGKDQGQALLAPITVDEYGKLEVALGLIWEAASSGELSEGQAAQIRALYTLLEDTHREAKVGETPRWKVVGPFARALFRLAKELPVTALGWVKLVELLTEMGWLETAARLTKLIQ